MKAEEIYKQIKDMDENDIEETMLAARVLGNVFLATEADQHLEQCAQMAQTLPLPYMCLVRGIEIGFLLGRSTVDGKEAPAQFGEGALTTSQIEQIFADLRARRAALEEARQKQNETIATPPEKKLILPNWDG